MKAIIPFPFIFLSVSLNVQFIESQVIGSMGRTQTTSCLLVTSIVDETMFVSYSRGLIVFVYKSKRCSKH